MTAPAAPHGTSQPCDEPLGVHADGLEHHHREGGEDAPAERDEHVVDGQLAREPHEVHAPAVGEPAASGRRRSRRPATGRWAGAERSASRCRCPRRKGKTLANTAPAAKGSASQSAAGDVRPALPDEVDGEQRQARTGWRCGRRTARPRHRRAGRPNSAGTLMASAAATARPRTTSVSVRAVFADSSAASGAMTSCFHSRSECSRANSRDSASRLPMRLTATRKASSPARPASVSAASWSRRWPSSSSTSGPWMACRRRRYVPPLRDLLLERSIGEGRHAVHAFIQMPAQGAVHDLPLLPLRRELRPAFFRDPVVLAPAAALGRGPLRRDVALALEPVQHRIEHAVGPLQVPARQLGHPLDDGVAVAVAFGEDGEHERRGGGGDQVLAHVHT